MDGCEAAASVASMLAAISRGKENVMTERKSELPARRSVFGDTDAFGDLWGSPLFSKLMQRPFEGMEDVRAWVPPMDIHEANGGYAVSVELPGATKDDISIECHDNLLTIKGEKRSEREEEDEHRHIKERRYGSFSRSVRLPADASEEVRASFKDGVLTVEIPKSEERKPRAVAIES
jgi:HSP20 family protein